MSAAVNGAAWIYLSFAGFGGPGWDLVGGTSEASPIFSGIVALTDQVAGHRLGLINPALYLLGALSQHTKLPAGWRARRRPARSRAGRRRACLCHACRQPCPDHGTSAASSVAEISCLPRMPGQYLQVADGRSGPAQRA